jgi:hypothetical protein
VSPESKWWSKSVGLRAQLIGPTRLLPWARKDINALMKMIIIIIIIIIIMSGITALTGASRR